MYCIYTSTRGQRQGENLRRSVTLAKFPTEKQRVFVYELPDGNIITSALNVSFEREVFSPDVRPNVVLSGGTTCFKGFLHARRRNGRRFTHTEDPGGCSDSEWVGESILSSLETEPIFDYLHNFSVIVTYRLDRLSSRNFPYLSHFFLKKLV